jgi:hypothetical protein
MVDKEGKPMVDPNEKWEPKVMNFMPDIGEFTSPIDGTVISSRAQLKEYEKRKGVIQVGNDQGDIIAKTKKRDAERRERIENFNKTYGNIMGTPEWR